jgi:hypothetical protein
MHGSIALYWYLWIGVSAAVSAMSFSAAAASGCVHLYAAERHDM